ncbi:MAG: leucine-rich repeat domain-containing protein, partial [Ruminococcaceae bacterium]|nr:leucine-rich repeat domain-containing protein [Oscillospiraceae bacterium]
MKKLLIKIVALITAAAVASGGLVFGDDLGGTDEEILVVNGNLAEDVVRDRGENEDVRLEYIDDSVLYDPEWNWTWEDWEKTNWDGVEFTYENEDYTCQYGVLNDGTVILLGYQYRYQDDLPDYGPEEIDIPAQIDGKDVTVIGNSCFWNIDTVTKVYIPSTVKIIGEAAFADCKSLSSIEIPDSVMLVCALAFANCELLSSIVIPDSVTLIGRCAFANCESLSSIEIPDSVTTIGEEAFANCESLTSIIIPESVVYVLDYAFINCTSLSSVEINGAASVGERAFGNCTSLESVEINGAASIGGAFEGCASLTSIEINGLSEIGNYAFSKCTSLTSINIPNSVVIIGDRAFEGCSSLSEVVIPDSVISIGWDAFSGCNLKNIYYTGNENLWYIITKGYYNEDFANLRFNYSDPDDFIYEDLEDGTIRLTVYRGMGSVNIPKTIDGKAVTVIGSDFLYNDGTITKVQIPDGVVSIEDTAFYNCGSLLEVTIPDSVTSIGEDAFEFCTSLENVYYTGTEEKWKTIGINSGNEYLTEAVCY